MRKILFGVVITLVILFTFKYCEERKNSQVELRESSALIQEQIKNVGKLVVTEGHFSEVFNYKNSKNYFGDYLTSEKKALVVVNAEVTIAYDLSQLEYQIDESTITLTITHIPREEIKISPELEYYDIQSDFFNPFEASDYNQIKDIIKSSLSKKLENSDIKANAKNRLISELSKFYILTNSLGWTLKYNQTPIDTATELNAIDL
jgi:hypothetical protein